MMRRAIMPQRCSTRFSFSADSNFSCSCSLRSASAAPLSSFCSRSITELYDACAVTSAKRSYKEAGAAVSKPLLDRQRTESIRAATAKLRDKIREGSDSNRYESGSLF